MILQKALFISLDDTLITTRTGRPFPVHSKDWRFIDKTLDLVEYHIKHGYKIVIATNQGGIEEGYLTERLVTDKLTAVCEAMELYLSLKKGVISYLLHPKTAGYSHKPNPGMAFDAAVEYELNLRKSVMVGSMPSDQEFAYNAGMDEYIDVSEIDNYEWIK